MPYPSRVPAPQPSSSSGSEERSPGLPPHQAREVRFLELQKVASSSSSINR